MEIGTKKAVALGCGAVVFPISLNLVPNGSCISLGSRATNYL